MRNDEKLKKKFLFSKKKNIFKYIYFFFQKLKGNKYIKKSYSGGGIDLLVSYYFRNKKKGTYIDIGCYHPIKGNNTYKLYKKGWSGVNIDLDFQTIDMFNHFRPNDENIQCAVSSSTENKNLYFYHDRSPINTLEKSKGVGSNEVRIIKTDTINNIIENSRYKDVEIDFISIDVEGHELEILKNFNFKKYSPKIFVIEYLDPEMKKIEFYNQKIDNIIKSDLYKLMTLNDYMLINWLHTDLVFINKKLQDN